MNDMERYGALLKRRREELGMTIEDVGRELGRPISFVWRMEQGRNANPPDPDTARRVWLTLGVSVRSQLTALGYLDADDPEPGVAHVVREDDPRAELLTMLAGESDAGVRRITRALMALRGYSGEDAGSPDSPAQVGMG